MISMPFSNNFKLIILIHFLITKEAIYKKVQENLLNISFGKEAESELKLEKRANRTQNC